MGGRSELYIYKRRLGKEVLTVVCNLTDREIAFSDLSGEIIIDNYDDTGAFLKPYEFRACLDK